MACARSQSIIHDQCAHGRFASDPISCSLGIAAPFTRIAAEWPILRGLIQIWEDVRADDSRIPGTISCIEAVLDLLGIRPFGDDGASRIRSIRLIIIRDDGSSSLYDLSRRFSGLIDSGSVGNRRFRDDLRFRFFEQSYIICLLFGDIDEDFLSWRENLRLILDIVQGHQILEVEIIFIGKDEDIGLVLDGIDDSIDLIGDLEDLPRKYG